MDRAHGVSKRKHDLILSIEEYNRQLALITSKRAAAIRQLNTDTPDLEDESDFASALSRFQSVSLEPRSELSLTNSRSTTKDYIDGVFPWQLDMARALTDVFHLSTFQNIQRGALNASLHGRDLFVISPTGSGKSLIAHIPASLSYGHLHVMIEPSLALLDDQKYRLLDVDIRVQHLPSVEKTQNHEIYEEIFDSLNLLAMTRDDGNFSQFLQVLLVTPEKLNQSGRLNDALMRIYHAGRLARFIIDEADSIYFDDVFRPDFIKLASLRVKYPTTPLLLMSATCRDAVMIEIINTLGLPTPVSASTASPPSGTLVFKHPLISNNLNFSTLIKPRGNRSFLEIAQKVCQEYPGLSGIIYCFSKKDTRQMHQELQKKGVSSAVYNGNTSYSDRSSVLLAWKGGVIKVICATNAFGRGINKRGVRFVIHQSLPKSFDELIQETGRAGRDGDPADCTLYYRAKDYMDCGELVHESKRRQEGLNTMLDYCHEIKKCSYVFIVKYLSPDQEVHPCGRCTNCLHPEISLEDVAEEVRKIILVLSESTNVGLNLTLFQLMSVCRGSTQGLGPKRVPFDLSDLIGGKMTRSADDLMRIIEKLILEEYVALNVVKNPYKPDKYKPNTYLKCTIKAAEFLEDESDDNVFFVNFRSKNVRSTNKQAWKESPDESGESDDEEWEIDDVGEEVSYESVEMEIRDHTWDRRITKGRVVLEDGVEEWEVESIVGQCVDQDTGEVYYEVKWAGWEEVHNDWMTRKQLEGCRTLLLDWDRGRRAQKVKKTLHQASKKRRGRPLKKNRIRLASPEAD